MVPWPCCFGPMIAAGTHVSQVFDPVHSKEQPELCDPCLSCLFVDSLTGSVSYL